MKTYILGKLQSALLAISIVLIVSQASAQQFYGNTSLDTKGIPLVGQIAHNGEPIATTRMFGEGTDIIKFDGNQRLILKDADGKIIAGFQVDAIDPTKAKPNEVFTYRYEVDGKTKAIYFQHTVEGVEFKNGKFTVKGPEQTVKMSWSEGEQEFTVKFKGVESSALADGRTVNRVTFVSDDGAEFVFDLDPSSSMMHNISQSKGDILTFFKKKVAGLEKDKQKP
jgi:hypothetical protein